MTLTPEQQQALDGLMDLVPKNGTGSKDGTGPEAGAGKTEATTGQPDLLQTWLGVSGGDVKQALTALLKRKDQAEAHMLDWVEAHPFDSSFEFLAVSSMAFYAAEKDENPKIKTPVDAAYYISTCMSVGYADIFAVTQPGRAIAALAMMVGPALTNAALNRPNGKQKPETPSTTG